MHTAFCQYFALPRNLSVASCVVCQHWLPEQPLFECIHAHWQISKYALYEQYALTTRAMGDSLGSHTQGEEASPQDAAVRPGGQQHAVCCDGQQDDTSCAEAQMLGQACPENGTIRSYLEAKQAAAEYQCAKNLLTGKGRVFDKWVRAPSSIDDFRLAQEFSAAM